jgi:condensin-2 complex subunit H2
MHGADTFAQETQLSKRVNEWQEKLEPLMAEQDSHPAFDIHEYGQHIVDSLERIDLNAKQGGAAEGGENAAANKQAAKRQGKKAAEKAAAAALAEAAAEPVAFGELAEGMEPYEACRMFLASLQLANQRNVLLSHAVDAGDAETPFMLQLLTTDKAYNLGDADVGMGAAH